MIGANGTYSAADPFAAVTHAKLGRMTKTPVLIDGRPLSEVIDSGLPDSVENFSPQDWGRFVEWCGVEEIPISARGSTRSPSCHGRQPDDT